MLKMMVLLVLLVSPILCAQSAQTQHLDSGALSFSAEVMDMPGMALVCRSNGVLFWETELNSSNMIVTQLQLTSTSVLVTGAFSQQLSVAETTLEAFGSTTIFVASFCRLTGELRSCYRLGGQEAALPQGLIVKGEQCLLVGEYDGMVFLVTLVDRAGKLTSVDLDDHSQLVWPHNVDPWSDSGAPDGESITQTSGSPADTSGNPGGPPPETPENPSAGTTVQTAT